MAIVDHRQALSIYQMVLDRLPFLVDDSLEEYTLACTDVDDANKTLGFAGDITKDLAVNQVHVTNAATPKSLIVFDFSYDEAQDKTFVTYVNLLAGDMSVGSTVTFQSNFNEQLISRYILQLMTQLQPCFRIDPPEDVGLESKYALIQKMIIADLVAWYILFRLTIANAEGDVSTGDTKESLAAEKYIASSNSGEVSVSWSYLKLSETGYLSLDAASMMANFKANAVCLAGQIGCNVEVCDDGSVSCSCSITPLGASGFRVASRIKTCKPRPRYK